MSSKRGLRRKACEGKIQYETRLAAAQAARTAVKKGAGAHMGYYRCEHCNQFHTGHLPKRIRAVIDKRRGV